MQGTNPLVHSGIMLRSAVAGSIKNLPVPSATLAFRIYNKALRTLGHEYLANTYFGAQMYCDPSDLIQRMILYFGVWEPDISRVIEQNLAPGDVFVDIGANVGYDSLLASSRVGPRGKVVAIEASPRIFAWLERNLAQNRFASNVRPVNAAASDRPGRLELYELTQYNLAATTTLASRGGTRTGSVDALPLDQILTADEIARVRLIKIDIEGAEPPLLRHLLEHLHLFPKTMDIIVEASTNEDPEAWQDLFNRLRAAGFVAYEIANEYELDWYLRWRNPTALRRTETLPLRQQDFLFTRRTEL